MTNNKDSDKSRLVIDSLTNFSSRELGDLESKMWKEGFRNMTKNELIFYNYFGTEAITQIRRNNFNWTYLEAKYLGVENKGENFEKMCKTNLSNCYSDLIKQMPFLIGHNILFEPYTDELIMKHQME